MHAIGAHASTGTAAHQMDDLALRQVIQFPSCFAEPEAVIHILKIHKEAFIQETNLLHRLPAQHQAGAGNILHLQRSAIGFVRGQIRAHRPSQEDCAGTGQQAPGTVTRNHAGNAQQPPE